MSKKPIYKLYIYAFLFISLYLLLPTIVDSIVALSKNLIQDKNFEQSLRFFLLEVPSILMLLCTAVFVIRIIRSYIPKEKAMRYVASKSLFKGNVIAGLFGIITPFCSCGVVPLFLGLVQAEVPLGVSISLLISAPMINEIALVLLIGLFGWQTALLYVGTGLIIAITSGYIIGRLGLERYIEDWVRSKQSVSYWNVENKLTLSQRIETAMAEVKTTVSKIWLFIILGLGVGSFIFGYVPDSFLSGMMGKTEWWSVPFAVLVGIPLYMNSAGIVPIIQVMLSKGAALGTSLAFMMSVIGLSLPEILILRKVLKLPLILIFITTIAVGITIVGLLFNLVY